MNLSHEVSPYNHCEGIEGSRIGTGTGAEKRNNVEGVSEGPLGGVGGHGTFGRQAQLLLSPCGMTLVHAEPSTSHEHLDSTPNMYG